MEKLGPSLVTGGLRQGAAALDNSLAAPAKLDVAPPCDPAADPRGTHAGEPKLAFVPKLGCGRSRRPCPRLPRRTHSLDPRPLTTGQGTRWTRTRPCHAATQSRGADARAGRVTPEDVVLATEAVRGPRAVRLRGRGKPRGGTSTPRKQSVTAGAGDEGWAVPAAGYRSGGDRCGGYSADGVRP